MIYGCEYKIGSATKVAEFNARNENEARLKMMKFAEKEEVYVQNIGKLQQTQDLQKEGYGDYMRLFETTKAAN